jgi:hypothetical protein
MHDIDVTCLHSDFDLYTWVAQLHAYTTLFRLIWQHPAVMNFDGLGAENRERRMSFFHHMFEVEMRKASRLI